MSENIDKVYQYIEKYHEENKKYKHSNQYKDLIKIVPFESDDWKDRASYFRKDFFNFYALKGLFYFGTTEDNKEHFGKMLDHLEENKFCFKDYLTMNTFSVPWQRWN